MNNLNPSDYEYLEHHNSTDNIPDWLMPWILLFMVLFIIYIVLRVRKSLKE